MPVKVRIGLPDGAERISATLDDMTVEGTSFKADLREDHLVEVRFRLPS